jgi:predicted DNA-binding protein
MKVRIEIHLEEGEVKWLDKLAKSKSRSRKNYCETIIKENIKDFVELYLVAKKLKSGSNNA